MKICRKHQTLETIR